MFTTNMKEKHEREVTIEGISPTSMENVLNFLYTEKVNLNEKNVTELLQAASIMRIMNLLEIIVSYLYDVLRVTNCLYFRDLGRLFCLEALIDVADKCVLDNFEEISLQPIFCELHHLDVTKLIASDDLKVDYERIVYEAVLTWVKHDLKNRKNLFPKLFKSVRLQLMETDYLVDSVRKEALVREFLDCRDLVEDAFLFHVNPQKYTKQTSRRGQKKLKSHFNPDSIIMFSLQRSPMVFGINQNKWIDTNENIPIMSGCAQATLNETTVFCGGQEVNNQPSQNVISFKCSEWKNLSLMNIPRVDASACYIKETLFVFGGCTNKTWPPGYGSAVFGSSNYARDFESYTDANQRWMTVGKVPTPRAKASAVSLEDCAYVIGGLLCQEHTGGNVFEPGHNPFLPRQAKAIQQRIGSEHTTKTMDVYNSASSEWVTGPSMRSARASFGAAVRNNRIYVVGGVLQNRSVVTTSEYFDSDSNVWVSINPNHGLAHGVTSACCVGDYIYVVANNQFFCRLDVDSNTYEKINCSNVGDWIAPITWHASSSGIGTEIVKRISQYLPFQRREAC